MSAKNYDGQQKAEAFVASSEDDAVLQFLDSLDTYLSLMSSVSTSLRQGWLDLASARHSMGCSRISSTLFDHKVQSAATTVHVTDPTATNTNFALLRWGMRDLKNESIIDSVTDFANETKFRHRGRPDKPETDTSVGPKSGALPNSDFDVHKERSKSLAVYGTLVSPKLRSAQVSFETALGIIVDLANARSSMLSSFSQLRGNPESSDDV